MTIFYTIDLMSNTDNNHYGRRQPWWFEGGSVALDNVYFYVHYEAFCSECFRISASVISRSFRLSPFHAFENVIIDFALDIPP